MLSARNQIIGTVTDIREGVVNGLVTVKFGDYTAKSDITMAAIEDLGLEVGMEVAIIIKATNIMFASGSEPIPNISARNQFPGTVTNLERGAINSAIAVTLKNGSTISGAITDEAIDELGLDVGQPAVAIIKATELMIATIA